MFFRHPGLEEEPSPALWQIETVGDLQFQSVRQVGGALVVHHLSKEPAHLPHVPADFRQPFLGGVEFLGGASEHFSALDEFIDQQEPPSTAEE